MKNSCGGQGMYGEGQTSRDHLNEIRKPSKASGVIMSMAIHAYAIAAVGEAPELPPGIQGAPVQWLDEQGIRCYFSEIELPAGEANAMAAAALEQHRVVAALSQTSFILPVRFGHPVSLIEDLRARIAADATRLRSALERLRDKVEMQITLALAENDRPRATSGMEHLQLLAARAKHIDGSIALLKEAAGPHVLAWKESSSPLKLRLFALIESRAQHDFSQAVAAIHLPEEVECRVVGPWPPSEFLDYEPHG